LEHFLTNLLAQSDGLGCYALIFGILVACGLGIPLPEDISLILGGFLAYLGAANLPLMMLVGFAGILCGDTLIFFAGRRVGSHPITARGFLARVITPQKRAQVQRLFQRHGEKIVMVARFLPGVRAVTYFTAGSAGMNYGRFILFDGLAALGSAPIFVYLGFRFGHQLESLIQAIRHGETAALVCLLAAAIGYFFYRRRRAAQRKLGACSRMEGSDGNGAARPEGDRDGRVQRAIGAQPLEPAEEGGSESGSKELRSRSW
jgi:membrane protein DedA with SNARE-associated domain